MLELFRSVIRVDVHIESMASPFNVVSLGNLNKKPCHRRPFQVQVNSTGNDQGDI